MAHIKCRYEDVYCGVNEWDTRGNLCSPKKDFPKCCDDWDYDVWNIPICEHAFLGEREFEKTVKQYEYSEQTGFNMNYPSLTIGKKEYYRISYLEIDGRVLIGEEDKTE